MPLIGPSAASCTITNTLKSAQFTVTKDWQPDNPLGEVSVSLDCENGSTVSPNPQTIAGDGSATFTVSGYTSDNPNCTATEDPDPPTGYSSTGTCSADLDTGGCTIVNALNSATFTVAKDWSPDNGSDTVDVSVSCSGGGTITPGNPQAVGRGLAVTWTISGYTTVPVCSATRARRRLATPQTTATARKYR